MRASPMLGNVVEHVVKLKEHEFGHVNDEYMYLYGMLVMRIIVL